jgi:hypothetical protein
MILDWTNWTVWLITLALVAFGFCLRYIYEQWYFRKVRKELRDDVREDQSNFLSAVFRRGRGGPQNPRLTQPRQF